MELTKEEMYILKHMLGADSRYRKSQWGFRNHFCSGSKGKDYETLKGLEGKGMVISRDSPGWADATDVFFYATEEGCKALGFTKRQIERTFEP